MKPKEYTHKINNLNVPLENSEYLVSAETKFTIDEDEDYDFIASFDDAKILDAIGRNGSVTDPEILFKLNDATCIRLNNDYSLCRQIATKYLKTK